MKTVGEPVAGTLTPAITEPSRVAVSWLWRERNGRPEGDGNVGAAGAGGVTERLVRTGAAFGEGSYSSNRFDVPPVPLPVVVINTRPSLPTAIPSGFAGRVTRADTDRAVRSITSMTEPL